MQSLKYWTLTFLITQDVLSICNRPSINLQRRSDSGQRRGKCETNSDNWYLALWKSFWFDFPQQPLRNRYAAVFIYCSVSRPGHLPGPAPRSLASAGCWARWEAACGDGGAWLCLPGGWGAQSGAGWSERPRCCWVRIISNLHIRGGGGRGGSGRIWLKAGSLMLEHAQALILGDIKKQSKQI